MKEIISYWNWFDVQDFIIENGFYSCGTNGDLCRLMDFISYNECNSENIYRVLTDILEHSDRAKIDCDTGVEMDYLLNRFLESSAVRYIWG